MTTYQIFTAMRQPDKDDEQMHNGDTDDSNEHTKPMYRRDTGKRRQNAAQTTATAT